VEDLRDQLKYGYSKEVLSVNVLLDKSLDQMMGLNNDIEMNQSTRYMQ
jgi:hypothetical protein